TCRAYPPRIGVYSEGTMKTHWRLEFVRAAVALLIALSAALCDVSALAQASLATGTRTEGPGAGMDSVVLSDGVNAWTATANASWLHLSAANQGGTGSANVVFSFDANPDPTRTGTLTIAGQTLTVTQAASTYVHTPAEWTALVSNNLNQPYGVA